MSRIPDDVIEQVRRTVDVADVVGRSVQLRKSGRGFSGLCPFHQEKTPSFHVTPERGMWKCFGCGKGGNVFTFLMEREGVSFPDAVRQLAREAGIPLPEDDDPEASARAAHARRLREVSEWACRWFERQLRAPSGEVARSYLKRRGIRGETARDFRIGWAPAGWENLAGAARAEGISDDDLAAAGLLRRRDDGSGYDWFRERVMFPIADAQGDVIAFGGRVLDDSEPKYLNSPETPIFSKGHTLYALHRAKREMMRLREAAVMEGYTDVILAHQAGFQVAVAGLGTALTPEQARKLAQYAQKLYLVYDADAAGMRAAERAIPAFLPEPIETRVVVLPGGKDPAEVIVEDGVEAFRAALAAGREAFEHLLATRAAAHDMASVPGRSQAVDEALSALSAVPDEVRRALYVKRLADAYGVPEDVASRRLQELRARAQAQASARSAPRPPASRPPDGDARAAASGAASGAAQGAPPGGHPGSDAPAAASAPPPAGPPSAAEFQLVEALLWAPDLLRALDTAILDALPNPPTRLLVGALLEAEEASGGTPDVERVVGSLAEPVVASLAAQAFTSGRGKAHFERQFRDCQERLLAERRQRTLNEELARSDDESEALRRAQEHHRRRSARPRDGA